MNWTMPTPEYRPSNPLFLCVLSTTDTAKIPGISAAGKTPEMTEYTPAGDAELVMLGRPRCISEPPSNPNGSPTPAVITRASIQLTGVPCIFIDGGLRVRPEIPLIDLNAKPASDIREGCAVSDARGLFERSIMLGMELGKTFDFVMIGESVPGGTTTALGVLRALGYDGRVSSSFSKNPSNIKEKIVRESMEKKGISVGDLRGDPLRAVELLGDSMMPIAAGLVKGLSTVDSHVDIVLAGGTQMMTVLALIKHMKIDGTVSIATTKFVAEDDTANFSEIVTLLRYPSYISDPGFGKARFRGLQRYEAGDVKEGVGAGGAMLLANIYGVEQAEFRDQVDEICIKLFDS
ncbi:hypothetical protein FHEFKHOI_01942 [Candidatus Methanoperedenaceae archaeon GB50]|nr:MAG: hypothetical protein KBONHNOK_00071 [Candidatus Methanoperedenaceae archaeon GB50]CAD7776340.1 hypothetical protein AIOGIFDO_01928 [Candidatus Methanoperedenaceae archaeon GB37]CAD7776467.1 hypothetical protein FHEFKHOI_01942 [Candidatus Methanoperedenaceae archaeon GB50]